MVAPRMPVAGAVVSQLRFDYAVTLAFDATFDLRIESTFTLVVPDQHSHVFRPGTDLAQMGPLITLHEAEVAAAEADERGQLRVAFVDGRRIECAPDPDYEAWIFSGPGGLLYVCLPGGGLAVWAAKTD